METLPYSTITILNAGTIHQMEEISGIKLFITLILVLLNGFFVAAEFAIVKVRVSQIDILTDANQKVASMAKGIINNLDASLAATQLGITLASLGLGWVGESSMTPVIYKIFELVGLTGKEWENIASQASFPIAFSIITFLHIVFGELAPKSIAIHYPTQTTMTVSAPLKGFSIAFKPVIWAMNSMANLILRMIGIKPMHGTEIHSEEELKMIITESQEGGAIEATERDLIQNVFDFDDRRVVNIQTLRKNLSALEISTTTKEAIDYTIEEGYSRFPVYEDSLENIKGILYTKDLVRQMLENPNETSIAGLLRKPLFISESAKIKNVLKQFQKKHVQMALVTNEVGELTGIVTMEDILEELVGEIQDEYDNEAPIVTKIKDGVYVVNAHHTLTDINRYLPEKFEESEHYDTLAGLISETNFDKELKSGDKIDLEYYDGIILKMYRNSVERIELHIKEDDGDKNQQKAQD